MKNIVKIGFFASLCMCGYLASAQDEATPETPEKNAAAQKQQYFYRASEITEAQFNKLWDIFKGQLYLNNGHGMASYYIPRPDRAPELSDNVRLLTKEEFKKYLDKGGVLYQWVKKNTFANRTSGSSYSSRGGRSFDKAFKVEYEKKEIEISRISSYQVPKQY